MVAFRRVSEQSEIHYRNDPSIQREGKEKIHQMLMLAMLCAKKEKSQAAFLNGFEHNN